MILSILIPTLPERNAFLSEMVDNLHKQIFKHLDKVEIIFDPREREEKGGVTTGEKRNDLIIEATGKYIWFVDDDDYIFPGAIENILKATEKNPDVIGINGIITSNGVNERGWEIRLGHPYKAIQKDGKDYYLRWPNHITPMKREKAIQIKFPHKTIFEDFDWSEKLKDSGLLKTQEIIEEPVYHYRERSK